MPTNLSTNQFSAAFLLFLGLAISGLSATEPVKFSQQIQPLLADRCFACHGPDDAAREAELRLDLREAAIESAIEPGSVENSELMRRIRSHDNEERMPPVESGKSLSADEIAVLERWIDEGAKYEQHWAFIPPMRPHVPETADYMWPETAIDRFAWEQMSARKLKPKPRAAQEKLLRHATFDLTGLPPTIEELDAFLADDSAAAWQRAIDRLFASPHFGEWMASDWLDVARFADTNGYQNDFARSMWPWRDWVIRSFQQNKPFDDFIVEQIAGDMLPEPTKEQLVATGFHRNHRSVTEGGSIEEEWRVENVVDRVETTTTALLSLTMGCTSCHDHKYDPITQREFYEFFAFFNSSEEKGVYIEQRGNVGPLVKLPNEQQQARIDELSVSISERQTEVTQLTASAAAELPGWLEQLAAARLASTQDEQDDDSQPPLPSGTTNGVTNPWTAVLDGSQDYAEGQAGQLPGYQDGLLGSAAVFTGKQAIEFDDAVTPDRNQPFTATAWVRRDKGGAVMTRMDNSNDYRGFDVLIADGKVNVHMIHRWPDNTLKVISNEKVPQNKWTHIAVTYDGSSKAAGIQIYINNQRTTNYVEKDTLDDTIATDEPFRVGKRSADQPYQGQVKQVAWFQRLLTPAEILAAYRRTLAQHLNADFASSAINKAKKSDANPPETDTAKTAGLDDELMRLYLAAAPSDVTQQIAATEASLQRDRGQLAEIEMDVPSVMIMKELPEPRKTYVLNRGSYDQPDKSLELQPGVPAALPGFDESLPRNRLGLAKWLVDPQNPLTARVVVNRLWQRFFGTGFVQTTENFGIQGDWPSHPELLDWLAVEFVESGWDIQHIQRLILTSAVYQQSADAPAEEFKADPDNRWLARGPRFRLPAEAVRDNALAVSGLLTRTIGGRSVMPYQPEGLWEELQGGAHEDYLQDRGEQLYRRSLYVYRKRTVPHPSMSTFDAPSWEYCQVRRGRTNTPLQALALMNDTTYVESARKLGERMMIEGGASEDQRLTHGFRLATARFPTDDELSLLQRALDRYRESFDDEAAAMEYLQHGESDRDASLNVRELAAYAMVGNLILNLDETVTKN